MLSISLILIVITPFKLWGRDRGVSPFRVLPTRGMCFPGPGLGIPAAGNFVASDLGLHIRPSSYVVFLASTFAGALLCFLLFPPDNNYYSLIT